MGLRATVYQITPHAFQAAHDGDYDSFGNDDMGEPLHIEQTWHVIYYLLTGDTELLLFPSGLEIELMSEYSEVHSPDATINISNRLKTLVDGQCVQDLDMDTLNTNKIYPNDWKNDRRDGVESDLLALSTFVENAASRKYGLFVFIA